MNKISRVLHTLFSLVIILSLAACAGQPQPAPVPLTPTANREEGGSRAAPTAAPTDTPAKPAPPTPTPGPTRDASALYLDPSTPVEQRVEDLLARMTLAEKIGQMTQVERASIPPAGVAQYFIGSILSGGGSSPADNTPAGWARMVDGFQKAALSTRLGIPILYGVDAVHGHNNLKGAVIFPHNIGLGAANDPALVEKIGAATAVEMSATGARWNFAPVVAVTQDIRWGRTYESYGENTELVSALGAAYVRGLQNASGAGLGKAPSALASVKHYIGDGATTYGSPTTNGYLLDQGDMLLNEATLRAAFLPPYQAAIQAGARNVMVSYSMWNGERLHGHKSLLTDLLKDELGFEGFIVSDYQGIDMLPGDYASDVAASINAGIDMVMVPIAYEVFIRRLTEAVESGQVPMQRIDDAVRRILTVKFNMGLFEQPYADPALLDAVGSDAHRALAREAAAKSLVLLKNDNAALPAPKDAGLIYVGGRLADDVGAQCGGWTITWQGGYGDITPGTSILEAVQQAVSPTTGVEFDPKGKFDSLTTADGKPLKASLGIVVVGEKPYAEGQGDARELNLLSMDIEAIQNMRARSEKLVVVLLSGRPLVITEQLDLADAWVAAWLPGTEGAGVTDVLFGDVPFTGKLSFSWPETNEQLPLGPVFRGQKAPLFEVGYGLRD